MMMCCVYVPREGSCRGFSAHPHPRHPKEGGKKVTVCPPQPNPRMVLIYSVVHVWLGVCTGEGGHIITHSAPDRTNCSRPAGARGFVFHPFFRGPAVVWVWPNDAAAINMCQRVWVSDSCTVDQGHTVLALSGRATPKKANPVWEH